MRNEALFAGLWGEGFFEADEADAGAESLVAEVVDEGARFEHHSPSKARGVEHVELPVVHPYCEAEVADVEPVFSGYHGYDVAVVDDGEERAGCVEGFAWDVVGLDGA